MSTRQLGGKKDDGLTQSDYYNIVIDIEQALFRQKTNRLQSNNNNFIHIFESSC